MRKPTSRKFSDKVVEDLEDEVAEGAQKRSDAVARLKACADDARKESAYTKRMVKRSEERLKAAIDGKENTKLLPIHINGALERAKNEAKARRRDGLAHLKRTTVQAVKAIRETVFLDPDELRKRLDGTDAESNGSA